MVNMRKVTHQTISEELSKTILLPCLFTLRPGSSHEPPRVKWTKVWGQRGSDGLQKEQSVLVAKDNVVKVRLVPLGHLPFSELKVIMFPDVLLLCFSPTGKKGIPGSRHVARVQREPLQRQPGSVWAPIQRLGSVPLRGGGGNQR